MALLNAFVELMERTERENREMRERWAAEDPQFEEDLWRPFEELVDFEDELNSVNWRRDGF